MTTTGTTPAAPRSTTGTITTEEEGSAAELAATAADLAVSVAELVRAPMQGTGQPAVTSAGAAENPIVPALLLSLSVATTRLLEGTPNPEVRAVPARAPSAATIMADKPGPIHHAGAPVWVAVDSMGVAEDLAVAVADIGNQRLINFQRVGEI